MAREIAAIGAVFAGGGAAPTPPPPEALPPVVAVSAASGAGSEGSRAPSRDRVELSAASVTVPGPATGGQKKEPQLQLPPSELRARVSR
jgi:hypothetical protein